MEVILGILAFAGIVVLWIIGILVSIGFYMLPAIIAFIRKHERRWLIFALDLILGATAIGWVVALIWACMSPKQEAAIIGGVKDQAESLKDLGEK